MFSCTVKYRFDMGHYVPELCWSIPPPASEEQALYAEVMREVDKLTSENVYVWYDRGARFYTPETPKKTVVINAQGRDLQVAVEWETAYSRKGADAVLLMDLEDQIKNPDYVQIHRSLHGDWLRASTGDPPLAWAS